MTKREYQKHEFCSDIKCGCLQDDGSCMSSDDDNCCFTAKEFHHWLNRNNFKIVKEIPIRVGYDESMAGFVDM